MNLTDHYNKLYETSSREILAGNYHIDHQINSSTDHRFGITLLIRPDEQVKENMQSFLDELKAIDPRQYYYPSSDIHLTVMSIISCYEGFELERISVPAYVEIIKKSLSNVNQFAIHFQGVTASSAAIMVQGFPSDNVLNGLRDQLRDNFKDAGLEESMDKRYAIFTAHATVVRFCAPVRDKEQLIEILDKYRYHDFGTSEVKSIELVYNDWYQRAAFVKPLYNFTIQ